MNGELDESKWIDSWKFLPINIEGELNAFKSDSTNGTDSW